MGRKPKVLSEESIKQAKSLIDAGMSYKDIAKSLHTSVRQIRKLFDDEDADQKDDDEEEDGETDEGEDEEEEKEEKPADSEDERRLRIKAFSLFTAKKTTTDLILETGIPYQKANALYNEWLESKTSLEPGSIPRLIMNDKRYHELLEENDRLAEELEDLREDYEDLARRKKEETDFLMVLLAPIKKGLDRLLNDPEGLKSVLNRTA